MGNITENLAAVRKRIEAAARKAKRAPEGITLVAVSKLVSAATIREAYEAGQRYFGENYAQELRDKAKELDDLDIGWHFIGHLQKNKAKYVAPVACYVETVDSPGLADALDKRVQKKLPCLIEVNVGHEDSKSGVSENEVISLAQHLLSLKNIELRGLMIIPPYEPNPETSRPYFKRLREFLAALNGSLNLEKPLRELSMGMSHDFEVAIEEGTTIVRVGTAIFGERHILQSK